MTRSQHQPAMPEQVLAHLDIQPAGTYVDMTVGGGGHAELILEASAPGGRLLGIDRDEQALDMARRRLARFGDRVQLFRQRFSELAQVLAEAQIERVDGILIDTGISMDQMLDLERGFSFASASSLDMRMDRRQALTAYEVVNNYSQQQLYDVLRVTGRGREARKVAARIVSFREGSGPIQSTAQLAELIAATVSRPGRGKQRNPAARWLMAIRVAVNDELAELRRGLQTAAEALQPATGRLVVLTWAGHEHRLARQELRRLSNPCTCPPALPCVCGKQPLVELAVRKALSPERAEVQRSPQMRSCRLHAVRALGEDERQTHGDHEIATSKGSDRE